MALTPAEATLAAPQLHGPVPVPQRALAPVEERDGGVRGRLSALWDGMENVGDGTAPTQDDGTHMGRRDPLGGQ